MVDRYNAEIGPDPAEWLALDEQLRLSLVEAFHHGAGDDLPEQGGHAVFHVIVENQLAEGLEPVVRAMARLRNEGLSRHDALHAIGSVLAEHVHNLMSGAIDAQDPQAVYNAAVDRLSAKTWRDQ